MRTECGAIGEILNAIAGFLPPNSPTSSRQNLHKRIRALRAIRKEPDATVIDVVMETAAPATSKVNW